MILILKILSAIILSMVIYNGGLASYWDFVALIIVVVFGAGIALLSKLILKGRVIFSELLSIGFVIAGIIGVIHFSIFYISLNQLHLAYRIAMLPILYGVILSLLVSIPALIQSKRKEDRRTI